MNKIIIIPMLIILALPQTIFSQEDKNMRVFQETKSQTGVILTIEFAKASYLILEPIELGVTITNESTDNIILNLTDEVSPAKIKIVNLETKKEVPLTLYGQKLQNFYLEGRIYRNIASIIEPSKCYKYNISLNRIFDLSLSSDYGLECEITYADINKKYLSVKTEPLKFSILEKPY